MNIRLTAVIYNILSHKLMYWLFSWARACLSACTSESDMNEQRHAAARRRMRRNTEGSRPVLYCPLLSNTTHQTKHRCVFMFIHPISVTHTDTTNEQLLIISKAPARSITVTGIRDSFILKWFISETHMEKNKWLQKQEICFEGFRSVQTHTT